MASTPFPALKEIQLHDLEILERWVATEGKEDQLTFPVLEEIDIKNCPKLTSLPEAPKLKVMRLDEQKALLSLALIKSRQVSSLSELQLQVHDTEATPPQIDQNLESSLLELSMQGCHFFFSSTSQLTFGAWKWFRNLVTLNICDCDVLIYWPEEVLQNLVSLKNLGVFSCNKLIGPTKAEGDDPTQTLDQVLPYLNRLDIVSCESLTELFIFPLPRSISLYDCPRLKTIWGNEEKSDTLEILWLFHCDNLVTLPSPPPSLKSLEINSCGTLRSVSGHLDALEVLYIDRCNKLQSLESLGDLPSLETLRLERCSFLAALPGSRGSYSSLRELTVKYCPAIDMKGLYKCHQQLLDSLEVKDISHAHSSDPEEGTFRILFFVSFTNVVCSPSLCIIHDLRNS
jgi:Leucine-rich repeat (LRR) protein